MMELELSCFLSWSADGKLKSRLFIDALGKATFFDFSQAYSVEEFLSNKKIEFKKKKLGSTIIFGVERCEEGLFGTYTIDSKAYKKKYEKLIPWPDAQPFLDKQSEGLVFEFI